MKKILLFCVIIHAMAGDAFAVPGFFNVNRGNVLYKKGEYAGAFEEYKNVLSKTPDSDIINFNAGAASYKQGNFSKAIEYFSKSLLSKNRLVEQGASYNIGNAKYKHGISQEDSNLPRAIELLEQSLRHYEQAIELDGKDEDAKYNYEFVKNELERLRKKEEQQQDKAQCKADQDKEEPQEQEGQGKSKQEQRGQRESQEEQDEPSLAQDKEESGQAGQPSEPDRIQEYPAHMTERQARMLLDNYQQQEEPRSIWSYMNVTVQDRETLKDW